MEYRWQVSIRRDRSQIHNWVGHKVSVPSVAQSNLVMMIRMGKVSETWSRHK